MSIKYYSDQSVVDTPRKQEEEREKKLRKIPAEKGKEERQKRERIAMVNGKLAIVKK